MIKRFIAISALCFALPVSAQVVEVENNGSIPNAQVLGLTGAGTVSISGSIATNPVDGKADYDFFNLGRFGAGGSISVRTSITSSPLGTLDTIAALYNSNGVLLRFDDDGGADANSSRNSAFSYAVTAEDNYFLSVIGYQWTAFDNALSWNPLSLTPGNVIGSQGAYTAAVNYSGALAPVSPTPPNGNTVPEPSGLVLSVLGLMGLLQLRRQRARV